jgi:cyclohexadieny/prephenate dehydrogenase
VTAAPLFDKIAVIGIGLIGSSIARAARERGLARSIAVGDIREDHCAKALGLGLCETATTDLCQAVKGADLVLFCVPIGANAEVAEKIVPQLKAGTIVSDVGSVKQAVVRDIGPLLPEGVHFVPGHPIAGTEFSGPEAGFADLFEGRWCILTPPSGTDEAATAKLCALWKGMGSLIEIMDPAHHDMVLAITSHLPHLIAYTIVGTATNLEESVKGEVIRYSASGFRDFTRIAASDPIMWRDVFLNNRDAVLEMLQRFTEDLTALQRAIRWGEGQVLEDLFTRTRAIRRGIIDAKQDS